MDARTFTGKLTLVVVVLVLGWLFNWQHTVSAPLQDIEGLFQPGYAFPTIPSITQKIDHPFGKLDLTNDPTHHFEKIAYRFVPFLIAHVLHLNQHGLSCLQTFLGLLFPLLVWKVLFDATHSVATATAGVVLVNGLYVGCAFFYDVFFFDGFAWFFLVCAMLRLPRWASIILMMFAAFTDERAVVAACLVPIWHLFSQPDPTVRRAVNEGFWQVGFLFAYAALRFGIGTLTGLEMGHGAVGMEILRLNLTHIVLLVWSVFEGGWILVAVAAFRIWDSRDVVQRALGLACLAGLACIFFAGLLVGDSIRSQQYAFPLLLMALVIICRQPPVISRRLIGLAIILTLLSPITIYLGMEQEGPKTYYNLHLLKPGYLSLFGL